MEAEPSVAPADAGRLAPIAALVAAARDGVADLASRLDECYPDGVPPPGGSPYAPPLVWHDTALFAVSSPVPAALSLDCGEPLPMAAVPGTPYWVALAPVEQGRLHSFRFGVGGEWSIEQDVVGFNPYSYELPSVKRGTVSGRVTVASRIYPGATTYYWLYVNDGIDTARGAPVMVWHNGHLRLEPYDARIFRMQIVTDNLVHLGLIPPMVHVLVSATTDVDGSALRGLHYPTVSDSYRRHLVEEVLPDAAQTVELRSDAYSRGFAGASGGGRCAFTLAWLQPDQFTRAYSVNGNFLGYPLPSPDEPKRNIRIWLSASANDKEEARGSFPLSNLQLANALKLNGYDFRLRFGEGRHPPAQAALDLPDALAWLWRDYDPERTEQIFEQEASERDQPPFRVRIVNRDAR